MDFLEILQRLLPFTTTQNGNTIFSISNLEPSDWIITIFSITLIVVFLYNLLFKTYQDKKHLAYISQLSDELESNKNQSLQTIENIAAQDKKLYIAWQAFQKNLVKKQADYNRIYDSSQFFNQNTLLEKIGKSSLSSTASFLLSIGLLGTFIGLFYGLIQLNMDNPDTLKKSMQTLIHASGAKFASSIWGLLLSILFGLFEQNLITRANRKIFELQNTLNNIFPLVISEQSLLNLDTHAESNLQQNKSHFAQNISLLTALNSLTTKQQATTETGLTQLVSILDEQKQQDRAFQTTTLEFFKGSFELQKAINENLKKIHDKNEQQNQEQIDILNELAIDIAESLGKELQATLTDALASAVNSSMDRLVKNIGGSEEETLYKALKDVSSGMGANFAEELTRVLDGFIREVEKKTGGNVETLNTTIVNINSLLTRLEENISSQNEKMADLIEELTKKIDNQKQENEKAGEAITGVAKTVGDNISTHLEPISLAVNPLKELVDLLQQSNNYLHNVPQHFATFERATGNLNSSATNTLQASEQLGLATGTLIGAELKVATSFDNFDEKLNTTILNLNSLLSLLTSSISEQEAKISRIIKELETKIDDQKQENTKSGQAIIGATTNVVSDITTNLQPISEAVKPLKELVDLLKQSNNYLHNVPQHFATFERATGNLNLSATNTLQASEQLGVATTTLTNAELKLATSFDNFDTKLNETILKLHEIPKALIQTVADIKAISTQSQETYEELATQHSKLIDTNLESAKILEHNLKNHHNSIKMNVEKLLKETQIHIQTITKEMQDGLSGYKDTSNEHIKNNLEIYDKQIKEFIRQANLLINKTFGDFDGSLERFAGQLASAIDDLDDGIALLKQRIDKGR